MILQQDKKNAGKYLKKVIKILLNKDLPPHDVDELLQIIALILNERKKELEEEETKPPETLLQTVENLRLSRVEIQNKINSLRWKIEDLEDDKYLIDSTIMRLNINGNQERRV